MDYVFAVCEGNTLSDDAEIRLDFMRAVELADNKSAATGKAHSVFPLKTPDWKPGRNDFVIPGCGGRLRNTSDW